MNKYLFLFMDAAVIKGWECFDPKEPVSDAQAVQQAFNMLICDDCYERVAVFAYASDDGCFLVATVIK